MKKLIYLISTILVLASCEKDLLPEPQKEDLVKKCSGCRTNDRQKVNDTVTKK